MAISLSISGFIASAIFLAPHTTSISEVESIAALIIAVICAWRMGRVSERLDNALSSTNEKIDRMNQTIESIKNAKENNCNHDSNGKSPAAEKSLENDNEDASEQP